MKKHFAGKSWTNWLTNQLIQLTHGKNFLKNPLLPKNGKNGLLKIWNGKAGTYGGIHSLSGMRFFIMEVFKEEKLVEKVVKYEYKITNEGQNFIKDEQNIDKELDRIWNECDLFYKPFFLPEVTTDEFKNYITLWSSEKKARKT